MWRQWAFHPLISETQKFNNSSSFISCLLPVTGWNVGERNDVEHSLKARNGALGREDINWRRKMIFAVRSVYIVHIQNVWLCIRLQRTPNNTIYHMPCILTNAVPFLTDWSRCKQYLVHHHLADRSLCPSCLNWWAEQQTVFCRNHLRLSVFLFFCPHSFGLDFLYMRTCGWYLASGRPTSSSPFWRISSTEMRNWKIFFYYELVLHCYCVDFHLFLCVVVCFYRSNLFWTKFFVSRCTWKVQVIWKYVEIKWTGCTWFK